jgi:hypothetical protein
VATETWTSPSAWTAAAGTEINSLASGNAVLCSVAISANTAIFCDLSFKAGSTVTTAAPNNLAFYLYKQGQDGSTFGDGRFTGAGSAGPPAGNYAVGSMGFAAAAGTTIVGVLTGIILPPGTSAFVVMNNAGIALPSSCALYYQTYNRAVA